MPYLIGSSPFRASIALKTGPFLPVLSRFGYSGLFETQKTIFLTGSKWISPLDIHIRLWRGSTVTYLIGSSPFTASSALRTGQNGPFWPIDLTN